MHPMSCSAGVLPPADDLVSFPFGLEENAARGLIKRGELRARKIGRRWYAKRSDVLGLIDNAPPVAPARASGVDLRGDLEKIAARTRTGGK
ncbi:MAG: helix-turn-helix domain-containing protein [Polyangiaceae bacterium]